MVLHHHRPVVLIVDDDPAVRALLHDMFAELGYEVMVAGDGVSALDTLATVTPDLMTLDLAMPGIDGVQVLTSTRQRDETRGVAVVVVSGQDVIPPSVRRMAQAIVSKPFEVDDLVLTVQQLVRTPQREQNHGG